MRGEPRLGAAGSRQRMRLAALLSFCLLALLQLHTFTTSPPLWCGNGRTIPRMEGASSMLRSKEWEGGVGVREQTGRELVCKILKAHQAIFSAQAPGPFEAVSYRALSQPSCPDSEQESCLVSAHLGRLSLCQQPRKAVCFLLKLAFPSPSLQSGLLHKCLFKWGPQAHFKGVPESE